MAASRPNVLFFFPDQHRPDWVGYDSDVPVRTPNLDDLTADGVAFRNATCPSPLCGPSRACLASGMEYDRCMVRDHSVDYPLGAETYYGRLRDEGGYHVMGCGKFDLQKHSGGWGTDGTNNVAANGFSAGVDNAGKWDAYASASDDGVFTEPRDPYMAYLDRHGLAQDYLDDFTRRKRIGRPGDVDATFPTDLPEHAYCDNWIARRGLELLDDAPEERPWHLVVNFAGPHDPWDVTEEMHGWYRDPDVDFPGPVEPGETYDPETHQEIRRNYAAMVENVDRWLGRYLERLERRGERENTVVVFASDHGEMLGDHGQWKKRSPYRPSAGVPLVISGPGVVRRGVVETPASVLDLHATVLEYGGVDPGAVDSRSLRSYLTGETDDHRDVVYSGIGSWRSTFDGRFKLVRGYDLDTGANEQVDETDAWNEAEVQQALRNCDPVLFDLESDPHETTNVADEHPDVVERLTRRSNEVKLGQGLR